jgi:hypothetical protein
MLMILIINYQNIKPNTIYHQIIAMLLDHKLNIQFIKNKCEEFVKNNLYNQ